MQILETIEKCSKFFNIDCDVKEINFLKWKEIPRKIRGVYIIASSFSNDVEIIYVGKGNIRTRQDMHYQKSIGKKIPGLTYPEGWKYLFENYTISNENWHIYYIELNRETQLSAMEGALIHFLKPWVNDEVWKDRNK